MSTPLDLEEVRAFLARKDERRRLRLDQRHQQACEDFERIIRHIVATCRPRRIYQWGSLIERRYFSEISDTATSIRHFTLIPAT